MKVKHDPGDGFKFRFYFRRLRTKVREIFGQCRGRFVVSKPFPDCLRPFIPNIFAVKVDVKLRSRRKTSK